MKIDERTEYLNEVHNRWLPVPAHWVGLDSREVDHKLHFTVQAIEEATALGSTERTGWPGDAVREIAPSHPLEVRAWRLRNGSRHVELIDGTEATWERYCAEVRERSMRRIHGKALAEGLSAQSVETAATA